MRKITLLPILFLSFIAYAQEKRIVLHQINVVDVVKGRILPAQTVILTGDRIFSIAKAGGFNAGSGDSLVDCKGQYLIPGLWDMHTHVWAPDYFFALFIANGVTGIRGMFEQSTAADQWRQRGLTAGELVPRGYYAGPIVDGAKPIWPGSVAAADADHGRRAVDSIKNKLRADFIKVYSLLEPDVFAAIADEAKKQGIVFAGHVPNKVRLLDAAKAGQKSMEHLYGFLELAADSSDYYFGSVTGAIKDSVRYPNNLALRAMLQRTFNEKKLAEAIRELKQYDTWICPTMTVNRGIAFINDTTFTNDSRKQYIVPMIKNMWDPKNDFRLRARGPEFYLAQQVEYELKKKVLKALHQGGIPILAGTDTPNPYCFPGFSLHDELEIFTECGLSPAAALQTATLNPARYFGIEKETGTIETGKSADLVILKANPLDNISNTRQISAVVLKGKFLGPEAVAGLLQKARKIAGN